MSSKLVIDSDWAVRGGNEEFKDWLDGSGSHEDWNVLM